MMQHLHQVAVLGSGGGAPSSSGGGAPSGSEGGAPHNGGGAPHNALHPVNAGGAAGVKRPYPRIIAPVYRRPASNAEKVRKQVMRGQLKKTRAGLKPQDLVHSRHTGKMIARSRSNESAARYAGSGLEVWNSCLKEARQKLGITGFCAVKGGTPKGKRLYEMAKALQRIRLG